MNETGRLLELDNVRLHGGADSFVDGTRGTYNVRLGSGVVHRQPGGMLLIVPVAGQHRPLLMARDRQIKGPNLPAQNGGHGIGAAQAGTTAGRQVIT